MPKTEVKKHKTTRNPVGGPRKKIDQDVFEGLCNILCTKDEICSVMDVSEKTISNWCQRTYGKTFKDAYEQLCLGGKASIRRNQFELSKKSATMAIFLGKQFLGQKDIPSEATEESINKVASILVSVKNVAHKQQASIKAETPLEKEGEK